MYIVFDVYIYIYRERERDISQSWYSLYSQYFCILGILRILGILTILIILSVLGILGINKIQKHSNIRRTSVLTVPFYAIFRREFNRDVNYGYLQPKTGENIKKHINKNKTNKISQRIDSTIPFYAIFRTDSHGDDRFDSNPLF